MTRTHIPKGTAVVVSVDPGVVAMGYCIWEKKHWGTCKPPVRAGVISLKRDRKNDPEMNISELMLRFKAEMNGVNVVSCYCETPVLFAGSKGHAAAAKGDLTDIAFMCGRVAEWIENRGYHFRGVPASEWKGQLPKLIVNGRICDILGSGMYSILSAARSHDWDACGIGLYAQNNKVFG